VSYNDGTTWAALTPTLTFNSTCFATATAGFATGQAAGQLYKYTGSVSAPIERTSLVAGKFTLSQNYPNPFNPSTSISYYLPINSDVKLEVFDMFGRKVASLVNERQSTGSHQATFNATSLSSGVYFYKLNASATNGASSSFTQTKKMLLVK
jgi:hypothetical protein